MANYFQREPIDGGDFGVWGSPELIQNRAGSIGQLTSRIYSDVGKLKVSKGVIGFDNNSRKGVAIIDTVTTISVAALTASRWALVEMSVSGTTPSFSVTSLAAESDPGAIPTTEFTDAYDPEKGGFYYVSNERLLGLIWINSGGALEGIVNCLPFVNGYQGYSISDDALDQYYRWEKNIENTVDSRYSGKLHLLNDTERPDAWVLNAGNQTNFTDVDFSAYVSSGVKALLLNIVLQWTGDGAVDQGVAFIRKNGSTEIDVDRFFRFGIGYTNLGAGVVLSNQCFGIVECDTDGIVEYKCSTPSLLYLNLLGYYLPENAG